MRTRFSSPDCHLDGAPIAVADWSRLPSADLSAIVGPQCPSGALENPADFEWTFDFVRLGDLVDAGQDGEPDGGWQAAYQRQLCEDAQAIAQGSPEYAGRDSWISGVWTKDTRVYPLFVVRESDGYRLWDGHHRLAGAFFYGLGRVAALIGAPKSKIGLSISACMRSQ